MSDDAGSAGPHYPSYPGAGPQPSYPATPSAPTEHAGGGAPQYASWGLRLAAYLLDGVFGAIAYLPFYVAAMVVIFVTGETDPVTGELTEDPSPVAFVLLGLSVLAAFGFLIWNMIVRQGRTGQSLGKRVVDITVLREDGRVMGGGLALGRFLLFGVLTTCTLYINALWPLWDSRKQALHDKVVGTVVLRTR